MNKLSKVQDNKIRPGEVVGNLSSEVGRFSVASFFSPDALEAAYQANSFGIAEEVDITVTAIRESAEKGDFSTALQALRHHRNIIKQAAIARGMFDRQTQMLTKVSEDGKTTVTVRTETTRIMDKFRQDNERLANQEVRNLYLQEASDPEGRRPDPDEGASGPHDPGDEDPNAESPSVGFGGRQSGGEDRDAVHSIDGLEDDVPGGDLRGDGRIRPSDYEDDIPGPFEDEDEDGLDEFEV